MSVHERKASLREFYGEGVYSFDITLFSMSRKMFAIEFYLLDSLLCSDILLEKCIISGMNLVGVIFPSLLQLQRGITDVEERKQREICGTKYRKSDEMSKGKLSEIEMEREEECGICMEINTKVVLPSCSHSLCVKCYNNW